MNDIARRRVIIVVMIVTVLNFSARRTRAQEHVLLRTVEEIRREAIQSRQSDAGRPLPLAAHGNVSGASNEGFTPEYGARPGIGPQPSSGRRGAVRRCVERKPGRLAAEPARRS